MNAIHELSGIPARDAEHVSHHHVRWHIADGHIPRASCRLLTSGDPNACTSTIDAAPNDTHDLAEAYYYRGRAYLDKHQVDPGIADLDQAIKLNPKLSNAFYERRDAYMSGGHFDLAISDFTEAVRPTLTARHSAMTSEMLSCTEGSSIKPSTRIPRRSGLASSFRCRSSC